MKKTKILGIIIIAILGAYLIYNHFDKINKKTVVIDKFLTEYTLLTENKNFKYSTIDEVIDIFNNKTGVILFCTPTSEWCQNYVYYLNEAVKGTDTVINYLNLKEYREVNTVKYQKILELLDSFVYMDDSGTKKIFMPDLSFVKDGVIVAHNNDTSLVNSELTTKDYYTNEKINEFISEIKNDITLMNLENIEE